MRLPRLQFSLRTLVILVVIVAALASWHGSRYARFRARVVAKAEMRAAGFALYQTKENLGLDAVVLNLEPSWLERWDRYWFGEEAILEYPGLQIQGFKFHQLHEQGKPLEYERLLFCFPELQAVDVSYGSPDSWDGQQPTIPLPPELTRAIGRLPRLERLTVHELGLFDDAWVAGLPESSLLTELMARELRLTPRGVSMLLKKSPRLKKLFLLGSSFDETLVAQLNQADSGFSPDKHDTPAKELIVWIEDPRLPNAAPIPTALQKLHCKYTLFIDPCITGRVPDESMDPAPAKLPPLVLRGYHATALDAWCTGELTIEQWPRLKDAGIHCAANIEVRDCALLHRIHSMNCDHLNIHDNPALTLIRVISCGQVQITDCPLANDFYCDDESTELSLRKLPSLKNFGFRGKSLCLHELPNLETMTIQNPTAQQLAELRRLSSLKNLTLEFSDSRYVYPDGSLRVLREIPTLQRLGLAEKIPLGAGDSFLRDLHELTNLRVLRMERVSNFELFHLSQKRLSQLPPNLEILWSPATPVAAKLAEILQQDFPRIVYGAPPYYGAYTSQEHDPDSIIAKLLEETPSAEFLRPYAVQTQAEIDAAEQAQPSSP